MLSRFREEKKNCRVPSPDVSHCAGKGTGMVAQRRIFPGEIILEEAPLILLPDEIYEGKEEDKASNNPFPHLHSLHKLVNCTVGH